MDTHSPHMMNANDLANRLSSSLKLPRVKVFQLSVNYLNSKPLSPPGSEREATFTSALLNSGSKTSFHLHSYTESEN